MSVFRLSVSALAASVVMAAMPTKAADFPYGQQPQPYQQPLNRVASAWQGFYVGAHAGYSWGNFDSTLNPGPSALNFSGSSISGGLFTGLNFQITPQFLAGIEGDLTFFNPRNEQTIAGQVFQDRANWQSTIRGRGGLTFDNYFAYLTGGLAVSDIELRGPGGSQSRTVLGWAIGAGLEGRLNDNVFARAEYLYTNYGSDDYALGAQRVSGGLDTHTIRLGIGYRF